VSAATKQLTAILDDRHYIKKPTDRDYIVRAFQSLLDQRSQFITFLTPRRAILKQFLIEAVVLTGLGGLLGVFIGVAITVSGGLVLPMFVESFPPPIVTTAPVLVAFAVSLVIGLLAGVYPANRAARLLPIEALRFE
jgi:putative ABC transport system permease protein